MTQELDKYYLSIEEPNRGCLLALRHLILKQDEQITETRKYHMPCFCYRGKAFCYLWTDKKTGEPYVLFVEGQYLEHDDLETGDRTRMKILRINPNKDLQVKKIELLLNKALNLYRNGTIKIK